jgi:Flp pilus assembly protein TadD/PAS domain-containing protein
MESMAMESTRASVRDGALGSLVGQRQVSGRNVGGGEAATRWAVHLWAGRRWAVDSRAAKPGRPASVDVDPRSVRGADGRVRIAEKWIASRFGAGSSGLRESSRVVVAFAMLLSALAVASCRQRVETPPTPTARLVEPKDVLRIVASRSISIPERYLTRAESIAFRCHVDPGLADIARASRFGLWSNQSGEWSRVAVSEAGTNELSTPLANGRHGLWISVIYPDGREILQPTPFDTPRAFVYVDTTAPQIGWVAPVDAVPEEDGGLAVPLQDNRVRLAWTVEESQLAAKPLLLEWREPGTADWQRLAEVPAEKSGGEHDWLLPAGIPPRVEVRLQAADAAGNEVSATIAMRWTGPIAELDSKNAVASADSESVANGNADPGGASSELADGTQGSSSKTVAGTSAVPEPSSETLGAPTHGVNVEPIATPCVRPGANLELSWSLSSGTLEPTTRLSLEARPIGDDVRPAPTKSSESSGEAASSREPVPSAASAEPADEHGHGAWIASSEAPLGDGHTTWTVPIDAKGDWELRFVARGPADGGDLVIPVPTIVHIDDTAPRVELVEFPEVLGAVSTVRIRDGAATGSGCDTLASVAVFVRPAGGRSWDAVDAKTATLEGDALRLDLSRFSDGRYEIHATGIDGASNTAATPTPSDSPLARFELDRTPPRILVRGTPSEWVSGSTVEISVEVEGDDAVPPLVIEGGTGGAGGERVELARIAEASGLRGRDLAVELPAGGAGYGIGLWVADRAGNVAREELGPVRFIPPVTLSGFDAELEFVEAARERITWTLHPSILQSASEWTIDLDHRSGQDRPWETIAHGLPATAAYVWEIPRADGRDHWIRLVATRAGTTIGEHVSARFRIYRLDAGDSGDAALAPASLRAAREASVAHSRYSEAIARGEPDAASLDSDRAAAEQKYREALAVDPKNGSAGLGLARLLGESSPESSRAEVIGLLEKVLELRPNDHDVLLLLGDARILAREFESAEIALRRAVAIRASGRALYSLGVALLYLGRSAEARAELERSLDAKDAGTAIEGNALGYLVFSYIAEGDLERARSEFEASRPRIPQILRDAIDARLTAGG